MTAPQPGSPHIMDRPACTPTAIRVVLAVNADPETLQRFDDELDTAFEQAGRDQDLTALVQPVRRWWLEADAWRDPTPSASSSQGWTATKPTGHHPRTSASPARRSAPVAPAGDAVARRGARYGPDGSRSSR